jgi:uncharacterized protein (DUF3084 family)
MDEKTLKHTLDVLGPFARDEQNRIVGIQARAAAAGELVSALNDASSILKEAAAIKGELDGLRASIAKEKNTLKNLEARASDITAGYKPRMIEMDNKAKELAARETAVLAREEKVLAREEKVKAVSDHLAGLNLDS